MEIRKVFFQKAAARLYPPSGGGDHKRVDWLSQFPVCNTMTRISTW